MLVSIRSIAYLLTKFYAFSSSIIFYDMILSDMKLHWLIGIKEYIQLFVLHRISCMLLWSRYIINVFLIIYKTYFFKILTHMQNSKE